MKTKHLFLVLISIFSFSCKTVKQTEKTNVQTEVKADLNSIQKVDSTLNKVQSTVNSQQLAVDNKSVDKGTVTKTTIEESETTNFSAPDSAGKQHATSTAKLKKVTTEGEAKNLTVNSNVKAKAETEANSSDKSEYKAEAKAEAKTKAKEAAEAKAKNEEKVETPVWVYGSVFILLFGLVGLIYLVLKRFKVVK